MTPRGLVQLVAFAAVFFTGCAYFNGLYNANRIASDARKAEREGRVGEARSLWSQVAVKAESVATRYTDSRHRDDALLLQGLALQATDECDRATPPLEVALQSSPDSALRNDASLVLGQCYFELADYESAIGVLTPLVQLADTHWAHRANLWRGKALLRSGSYENAIADLQAANGAEAAFDLSIAYSLQNKTAYARAVLDAVVDGPYDEPAWQEALDTLGGRYPEDAAAVVNRLVERGDLTEGQEARLLLAEGRRWAARGEWEHAAVGFRRAAGLAPDSADGLDAAAEHALARIRSTGDLASLPTLVDSLEVAVESELNGPSERAKYLDAARDAVAILAATHVADTGNAESGPPHPDLDLFLSAEQMRDLLGARPLASAMFRRVAEGYPSSAIAPKAIIAAAQLDPTLSDSLLFVLRAQYATSPYTLLLKGIAGDRYAAIEDSLRMLTTGRKKTVPREN